MVSRQIIGLLLLLNMVPVATGASLAQIKQRGTITVGVYNAFPPFSNANQGIDLDVATLLASKLGVDVEFLWFTAEESMDDDLRNMVQTGTVLGYGPADVMMHVPIDSAFTRRNEQFEIFAPYFRDDMRIARNVEQISFIDHMDMFEEELIAVEKDSSGSYLLASVNGGKLINNLRHYNDIQAAFSALKAGDIGAVFSLGSQAQASVGDDDRFAVQQPPLGGLLPPAGWAFGLAVKKDNAELAAQLSKAMHELEQEGEIDKVFASYNVNRIKP